VHVLNRHVDQAAEDRHAGIVDPRVEAPETLDRGFSDAGDVLLPSHIAADGHRLRAR